MDNLAQVIGQTFRGRGSGSALLVFLLLLASCGPKPISAPVPQVIKAPPAPDAAPPPPDFGDIPGHPLANWTYADSLDELHAIWSERFTLSATPNLDPNTLWPYADAIQLDGASWGMSAETTKLVYIATDGHAYQRTGAAHPKENDGTSTSPITAESLSAMGWETAQSSPGLQRFEEGSGFRVAGPIRTEQSCQACHTYAPDQVVALLVYDFQEIPDD